METIAGIQQWQFKRVQLEQGVIANTAKVWERFDRELERLGAEGWELVGVTASGQHGIRTMAYLKRPVPGP